MFGAFADCAPDRWGRRLINRAERDRVALRGAPSGASARSTTCSACATTCARARCASAIPSERSIWPRKRRCSAAIRPAHAPGAAERLEEGGASEAEVQTLLRGGSSLGGARPKAHVLDRDGRLAIAKFPSPSSDEWDVMRWEAVALELARRAGIAVPRLDAPHDRRQGGADRRSLRPYRRPASRIRQRDDDARGNRRRRGQLSRHRRCHRAPLRTAVEDLRQLWRRIAFSILISNTDDHLRNHGFLRTTAAGWSLSPAFDLNPDPRPGPKHLSTAIDFDSTAAELDTLIAVAGQFRLADGEARAVLQEVYAATSRWRAAAHEVGLDSAAVEQMAGAFEHRQAEKAQEIAASPP